MRVLCLGNNTEDTDARTRELADTACHGLLSELDGVLPDLHDGWYHSSVYDIEYGRLVELAEEFDQVLMLDQPKEQYSHPDAFYRTVRLVKQLKNGKFLDDSYAQDIDFFENLVKTNSSFCIFPFIELLALNGNTTVCCRSTRPITKLTELTNFQTDKNYLDIRSKMLQGELVPDHCSSCYKLEQAGIISARQQETVEWANRLGLSSVEDLQSITTPVYYEVRPSNVCNLQCRSCSPSYSHLIAREYKRINLVSNDILDDEYSNFDFIDFSNLKKLYVAGGEPTAMPEFYDFLDRCIQQNKTDFEFVVNTNATKINSRFKKQLEQFDNFQFIVSIDGLDQLNHYIRWPSNWSAIVENVQYLSQRHVVSFNVTVSIYNINRLYSLLEFFDQQFPKRLVHAQLAMSNDDMLSALNFPDLDVDQLKRIRNLNCYKNDPLLASTIDGLISHYEQDPTVDLHKLKTFFAFNDRLDASRSVKLLDYIPELEQARQRL